MVIDTFEHRQRGAAASKSPCASFTHFEYLEIRDQNSALTLSTYIGSWRLGVPMALFLISLFQLRESSDLDAQERSVVVCTAWPHEHQGACAGDSAHQQDKCSPPILSTSPPVSKSIVEARGQPLYLFQRSRQHGEYGMVVNFVMFPFIILT